MTGKDKKMMFLFALYITSMVLVNTLGSKITTIAGVRTSVGVFFIPILFLVTDIIGEVHGRKVSALFVNYSAIMLLFMFLMMALSIQLPPNPTWTLQESYESIFGSSMRMTVASLISFYAAQQIDVLTFSVLKALTKKKHLWIRNNVSTILSQFIDTTVFMFLAFYRMSDRFTIPVIFSMIIPYWLFKVVLALLDTPLCYLGVYWLRKEKPEVASVNA